MTEQQIREIAETAFKRPVPGRQTRQGERLAGRRL